MALSIIPQKCACWCLKVPFLTYLTHLPVVQGRVKTLTWRRRNCWSDLIHQGLRKILHCRMMCLCKITGDLKVRDTKPTCGNGPLICFNMLICVLKDSVKEYPQRGWPMRFLSWRLVFVPALWGFQAGDGAHLTSTIISPNLGIYSLQIRDSKILMKKHTLDTVTE